MKNVTRIENGGLKILFDLVKKEGGHFVNDSIHLPSTIGTGYVQSLVLEPGLKAIIHQVTLSEELILKRSADLNNPELLLIAFNIFVPGSAYNRQHFSSVQITSSDIEFTTIIPAQTEIFTLGISIEKKLLLHWFELLNETVPNLLITKHPIVLDNKLTPEIRRILSDFALPRATPYLPAFFYKIKIQELLYWLFNELLKRTEPSRFLHSSDVEKIYEVKHLLLSLPNTLPSLAGLAASVNISEAKLKQLFKQIFGTSTYSFYQMARMEEAARLLLNYSVTEVGYQLGFSNLSHFARLFKKHHQLSPKKYQSTHHQ